ncbi:MAG: queuosine salvage family protein [bacterium]|nr:queuosine salvage family protein [bacterium]
MKLDIVISDSLNILQSTKSVVENSRYVFLNGDKIREVAVAIAQRIKMGLENAFVAFGASGDYEKDIQLIFIEDAVNFCFWAEKGQAKWQVEWPVGNTIKGGWYCLKACFERALAEGVPILEADYLCSITEEQVKNFFRGINGTEIPLIQERQNNLREAGRVLKDKFDGQFINVLKEAGNDAIKLVKLLYDNFPSFRDEAELDGKKVYFLKRAQICANDISYLEPAKNMKNLDQLTAFADYKLPQILKTWQILEYKDELAKKIDNYTLLSRGSREEIEIRSATIWAVELIRQELNNEFTASKIDNALWLLSQDLGDKVKPYHRTRTNFY